MSPILLSRCPRRSAPAAALALTFGAGSAAFAESDLTAKFSTMNGQITVAHAGSTGVGASVVTLACKAQGGGACPQPDPAQAAAYDNPRYPDVLSVSTTAIRPGRSFTHNLSFWSGLKFPVGTLTFTVCADAGKAVTETNEGNNCASVDMKVNQ